MGPSSTKSTFSDNTWYYIYFIQKERAVFEVKNTANTVLKIRFDNKQNVSDYTVIKNNAGISISTDITESNALKRGLVRELLDSFIRRLKEPN